MTSKAARFDEILTIIQNIIADLTGNEIEDVDPEYDLEEDLNITPIDFRRIISTINSSFDIELDMNEDEIETVEELSVLVQEESELG